MLRSVKGFDGCYYFSLYLEGDKTFTCTQLGSNHSYHFGQYNIS